MVFGIYKYRLQYLSRLMALVSLLECARHKRPLGYPVPGLVRTRQPGATRRHRPGKAILVTPETPLPLFSTHPQIDHNNPLNIFLGLT